MTIALFDWTHHSQAIERLSRQIYHPDFWEDPAAYQAKLRAFPPGCLVGLDCSGAVVTYTFGHPWRSDHLVPDLGSTLDLPISPDCYYIHDLAVHPNHRGSGIGSLMAQAQISVAHNHNLSVGKLVAVLASEPFWERFGFVRQAVIPYGKGRTGTVMVCHNLDING